MLKRALGLAVVLAFAAVAAAQNEGGAAPAKAPWMTVFGGYSFANTNYLFNNRSNLHGYEVSVEHFHLFFPHTTLVVDGAAHYGWNAFPISCVTVGVICANGVPPNSRAREYDFLGGPQYSFTRGRFRPFLRVMGGAGRATMTTPGFFDGSWAWEIAGGGGVDYRWRGPFDWRVSGDYLRTNFFNSSQNGYRVSTGIVIKF